jgi:hypothetical protein
MVPKKNRPSRNRKISSVRESVLVHNKDIRFVSPAPQPPFEPPRPNLRRKPNPSYYNLQIQNRNRQPGTGNSIRPLDPRASRQVTGNRKQLAPCSRYIPRPVASRTRALDPKPQTQMSRENFLRNTGLGGVSILGALVGIKRSKKKRSSP